MSQQQQQGRLNIVGWLSPVVAFALLAFLFTSSIGRTQDQTPTLICTISSFYSVDANEQISDTIRIEGRGLAVCRNDQGFSTDIPVSSVITARAVGDWTNAGEISFSGNSSSFVVPRDIGQMQDTYDIKPFASDLADQSAPTILFGGRRHDLMIEMRFSSSTQAFQKIDITSMSLHFDESAPTLD